MSTTKSSLEAAAEAAARVNAMLMAKGKLKLPAVNAKPKIPLKSTGDLYTTEVEINESPLSARNLLTRGLTQDEISKYSGAAVSTRGRYMTFDEKAKNGSERPLYLHIQASNKDAVDLAVMKIQDIIHQHSKNIGGTANIKWTKQTIVTSSANVLLPAVPVNPVINIPATTYGTGLAFVQDKVFVGLEHVPIAFQLKEKLFGPGGSYLQHIRSEVGATVTLRGKGSGYLEPTSGREAFEPLHIHITHPKPEGLKAAKELALNLIQTTQQEYLQWQQQQQTIAMIAQQQHSLAAHQNSLSSGLQTVSFVGLSDGGVRIQHTPIHNAVQVAGGLAVQAAADASLIATSVVPTISVPSIIASQANLNGFQNHLTHSAAAALGATATIAIPQQPVTVGYIAHSQANLDSFSNSASFTQTSAPGLIISQSAAGGTPVATLTQLPQGAIQASAALPIAGIIQSQQQQTTQQQQTAALFAASLSAQQLPVQPTLTQAIPHSQAQATFQHAPQSLTAYPFQNSTHIPCIQVIGSLANSMFNHQIQVPQSSHPTTINGFQDGVTANFSMPPPPSPIASQGAERKERDKQLMPPPPRPQTHGLPGSKSWNNEPERKRLRGALGNIVVYGSSDEEDDEFVSRHSPSPPGRHKQRSTSPCYRGYNSYSTNASSYSHSRNDESSGHSHYENPQSNLHGHQQSRHHGAMQGRSSSSAYSAVSVPFWMAPH